MDDFWGIRNPLVCVVLNVSIFGFDAGYLVEL